MPLRYVRTRSLKVSTGTALSVAITTTSIASELADIAQFPPVKAAATILLVIFQTIQSIQTNRADCYRLARRCLSLLVDIKDQLEGRWADAPETLLKNVKKLERTLETISTCMTKEAEHKWRNRLLRKSTIEASIADFNADLDDAVRSFQIATLIDIHYAVGDRENKTVPTSSTGCPTPATPPPQYSKGSIESFDEINHMSSPCTMGSKSSMSFCSDPETALDDIDQSSSEFVFVSEPEPLSSSITVDIAKAVPAAVKDTVEIPLDHRGFRRYHQSDVVLKGRSTTKTGWWAGSKTAEAGGRSLLMKPYEGIHDEGAKKWMRDVKILQNLYHPNLPQMVGYSDDASPTPFILLANVQTRLPQALVLDTIQRGSLLSCAQLLLRLYRDTFDAALYMQRQLNLSDSKTQDYVENSSFRIDAVESVIMGLPPPEVDNWVSFRNYGLAHSIRDIYLKILPNRGFTRKPHDSDDEKSVELQHRINHLAVLIRALLPGSSDVTVASERLKQLLGEGSEDEELSLSLAQVRVAAISAGNHDHTWSQNTVPPYKYSVGDLGYVPEGKDFDSFVVLCNVSQDGTATLNIDQLATGWQSSWVNGFINRQQLQPFYYPPSFSGWPVVLPPGHQQDLQVVHEATVSDVSLTWKFLLDNGRTLARAYKVNPQDLILITRVGTDQRFMIKDLRILHVNPFHPPVHPHHGFGSPAFPPQMNRPGFGHHPHAGFGGHHQVPGHFAPGFPGQPLTPLVLYLFTSPEESHEPTWSETPMYQPSAHAPMRAKCACSFRGNYGFMNYVQLHEEDFA